MSEPKWLLPSDRPKQPQAKPGLAFDQPFLDALRKRSEEATAELRRKRGLPEVVAPRPTSRAERQPSKVSVPTILMTLALLADPRLRDLYKQNLKHR